MKAVRDLDVLNLFIFHLFPNVMRSHKKTCNYERKICSICITMENFLPYELMTSMIKVLFDTLISVVQCFSAALMTKYYLLCLVSNLCVSYILGQILVQVSCLKPNDHAAGNTLLPKQRGQPQTQDIELHQRA